MNLNDHLEQEAMWERHQDELEEAKADEFSAFPSGSKERFKHLVKIGAWETLEEEFDQDFDPCQCSDPCCPCSGRKH